MNTIEIPTGTKTLIFSKLYYGVLTKNLAKLDIDRYFAVILFLNANEKSCQQTICNNLMMDKAAMVKVLDYLTKAGYIHRITNPNDRREHFIELTEKGIKKSKEIIKSVNEIEQKAFSGVSKKDAVIFNKVLHSLSNNIKELPSTNLFFNYKNTKNKPIKKTNNK